MLFRRLAIFAGGFELEAVEEVCAADDDLEPSRIADLLARLVEKSLVAVEEAGRGRRYRLLETVRMYARERLDEAGEWPALADRHARWALALAEREHGSPRLDREAANLRAALATCFSKDPSDAVASGVALLPFWLRRIDLEEARRRFAAVVEAAPEATALRAEALLAAAAIELRSGTLAAGLRARREELRRRLRDRRHASRVAGAAVPRRVRHRERLGRRSGALARARPRARAKRGLRGSRGDRRPLARRRALDSRRPCERRELVAESIELFRAREGTPDTIPSPLNIAEIRTNQLGRAARPAASSSRTRSSPCSRSPAVRPSATRWQTRPGSRASAATSIERGRCSTKALPVSRRHETTRGSRRFLSVGRTSR